MSMKCHFMKAKILHSPTRITQPLQFISTLNPLLAPTIPPTQNYQKSETIAEASEPSTHLKNQSGSSSVGLLEGQICHLWRAPKNGSGDPARPGGEQMCFINKWQQIWMLTSQRWNPSSQKELRVSLGQASYLTSPMRSCDTMRVQKVFYPDMPHRYNWLFFGPVIRYVTSCCNISLSTSSCLNPWMSHNTRSSQAQRSHHSRTRTWDIQKFPFFWGSGSPKNENGQGLFKQSFIDWTLDKVGQKTSKKSPKALVQQSHFYFCRNDIQFNTNLCWITKERSKKIKQNTSVIYRH